MLYLISNQASSKYTFIKLLKSIFEDNCTIIGNHELSSKYNAGYLKKRIICCEENIKERRVNIEKIKSLFSAEKVIVKEKGLPKYEIDFHGKFILLGESDKMIRFHSHDKSVWIIKVPEPKYENIFLLIDMIEEIQKFIRYLRDERELSTDNESRLWFNFSLL